MLFNHTERIIMKKIIWASLLGLSMPLFAVPIVKMYSSTLGVPNTEPFWVNVRFSEPVLGFQLSSISLINGTLLDINPLSAMRCQVQILPPASGTMSMVIPANAVTSVSTGTANRASNTLLIQALNAQLHPSSNFDLSQFDLNTPLPLGGSLNINIPSAVLNGDPARNTGYTNAPYFNTDASSGAMHFFAPLNGATTDSNYPRSELRESKIHEWMLKTYSNSTLTASLMVTENALVKRKLVIGQIHDTGEVDKFGHVAPDEPMLKMIYDGNLMFHNQTCAGCIRAQIRLTPMTALDQQTDIILASQIPLNTLFTYSMSLQKNGLLTIKAAGKTALIPLSTSSNNTKGYGAQKLYFKAGVYLQENGTSSTTGGATKFYYFNMKHTA